MVALKYFVDACLSPELALRLIAQRHSDALAARDRKMLRTPDHVIREFCIDEERVIITHNADDFRKLVGKVELHPGLIILEENAREPSWRQLEAALAYITERADGDEAKWMCNRVVDVAFDENGDCVVSDQEIPPPSNDAIRRSGGAVAFAESPNETTAAGDEKDAGVETAQPSK